MYGRMMFLMTFSEHFHTLNERLKRYFKALGGVKMKVYEVLISGSIKIKAENEGDAIEKAIEKAISIGADEYYGEVIDSYEVEEG